MRAGYDVEGIRKKAADTTRTSSREFEWSYGKCRRTSGPLNARALRSPHVVGTLEPAEDCHGLRTRASRDCAAEHAKEGSKSIASFEHRAMSPREYSSNDMVEEEGEDDEDNDEQEKPRILPYREAG